MFQLLLRNIKLSYQASSFYVVGLIVANVIFAALDLSTLFILARLIDLFVSHVASPGSIDTQEVWWWFGALIVRWTGANLCLQFIDYLNDVYKPRVLNFVDTQIVVKLNRLPAKTIESSSFQDHMTNIHTFGKVKFVENLNLVGTLVQTMAACVYALIALLLNNPLIALLVLLVSIPEVRYNLKIIRKMRDLNEDLALERRRVSYFVSLTQDVTHYFNLKSYNLFPYFLKKVKKAQGEIVKGSRDIQRYHKPRSILIGTLANLIGQFIPKGYYVLATLTGKISIGQFQLYYRLIDQAYNSSYNFYMAYLQVSENNIYVKDLFELLDMPDHKASSYESVDLHSVELEFKNVSFVYPESSHQVLHKLNFKVRSGQKLALVGHNGAGKTTITKLINKFYEPTEGTILVNGVDLRKIDPDVWRKAISNLSQDVPRFFLSAKENVTIGDFDAAFDRGHYLRSTAQAMIDKDIAKLPKKDESMLGKFFPGGVGFSGGQWQKLSIARSFYRQAPLLILDEPTSAVDSRAEQAIFEAIFAPSDLQAQLIISHKFSNIKNADGIIVLNEGRIIQQGTHESLMTEEGEYATLYRQQSAAFTEG